MHKGHMTVCIIAIGAAFVVFTATGGSTGGLGLLLAALICPIAMGAVMWFLMGSQRQDATAKREVASDTPALDASATHTDE